ncbi:hypothetical protein BDB00DRAFT_880377 [Zychaea mexicana]|uniref:uncharacterized protein n=1 Tax=Zychaea mexicana TaxID=64656 RepID=UPI0022FF23B7|nr:uncharacterized protein BDB00DRAFT_880377 [Zychaea mexicana]KAI9468218.1 hypothetical protein BDB00DRAFT_880377 [Zychaea mexicana]
MLQKAIEQYILDQANHPLKLDEFIKSKRRFIASIMDLSENYKDLWSARFAKIVRKHNLTVAKSQVDWGVLTTAFFEHLSKNQSATPSEASSTKNTTTTNNTTPKLKEGDYKKFDAITGTVVEDKVKELAMKLSNEHPSHSMILDTSDPVWLEYFTKSELKEIEDEKKVTLSELPKSMQTYLDCYNGLPPPNS